VTVDLNSKSKSKVKDPDWARAKRLCRLSNADVRMAKELGFKPGSLIKNIPNGSERWKAPVAIWVRDLYAKSLRKQAERRARRNAAASASVEAAD
jgi:hypothetical protein